MQQAPVAYTITPFGESLTFHAQCFQAFSTPGSSEPSFFQIQLDGTSTDSLRFDPAAPTSGVAEFTFGPPPMPGLIP